MSAQWEPEDSAKPGVMPRPNGEGADLRSTAGGGRQATSATRLQPDAQPSYDEQRKSLEPAAAPVCPGSTAGLEDMVADVIMHQVNAIAAVSAGLATFHSTMSAGGLREDASADLGGVLADLVAGEVSNALSDGLLSAGVHLGGAMALAGSLKGAAGRLRRVKRHAKLTAMVAASQDALAALRGDLVGTRGMVRTLLSQSRGEFCKLTVAGPTPSDVAARLGLEWARTNRVQNLPDQRSIGASPSVGAA